MKRKYFRIWCLVVLVLSCFVFMGQSCCTDNDGDGYYADGGDCGVLDCNDSDSKINPGADEICSDGIDNDCDFDIDEQDCADDDNPATTTTTIMEETTTTISAGPENLDTIESIGENIVPIPSGTFEMGCSDGDKDCGLDEYPSHTVTISSFKMSSCEVTQGQWKAVMGSNPSYFSDCGDDCPVETVSWNDAQNFIDELNSQTGKNYRLPTEAEWEYAARAGTTTKWYCGDYETCLDDIAWYNDNSGRQTHPAGQKQPNARGIYDISGNVWEWVADSYDRDYYEYSPSTDPQGPSSGSAQVLRGGSWNYYPWYCRSSYRFSYFASYTSNYVGFRLVLP